ncbi:ferritin-like domain-containing protein [Hymenobacter properus]|uniref:PA2169 family four-helix-bundle protein n=1 Tax=Hymenobacter properus TaxID=2791026 RepID=A0A931FKE4_9BACT|nr:PA2169 family four-helix-bundle protein [Hymenobacter properus]MBF9140911.1 PA2169 family four-helix-bundle protein [Hymenobacter properus]MBR7719720.1 PA2169 family four-helix-bundle protein [Microvirga sp. SRT04]
MSHPNSPRVSADLAAASAPSHASDAQALPTQDTPNAANNGAADSAAPATGPTALLTQAKQWAQSVSLPDSLKEVPAPLQRLAGQAGSGWRQLSTTQKVVGGALLAGAGWLVLRPGKAARRRKALNPVDTLHELLLFVNDRVQGYRRAASESHDADLRNYYEDLAGQSKQFAIRLNGYLRVQQHAPETGTTLKGKLYRAWMEAKAAVTGYSETAVLASNVYGEEWALSAYEAALRDRTVTGTLRREIERQYEVSQQTYHHLQQLQAQY